MVPMSEYEKTSKQLQVLTHREMDLLRRQSELYVQNAALEDRLRTMMSIQDKNNDLEAIQMEADHELSILRKGLS